MTYSAAKAQCESDGAFLAIPRSNAENDFIVSLIPNENIWIGVNDIKIENSFVADDGCPLRYTNWIHDQPDNYQGLEHVVTIHSHHKKWNDVFLGFRAKFVCSKSV